jgi:hypothetical protein
MLKVKTYWTWDQIPGELEARDTMDSFMSLVSRGEFLQAITLCPVFAFVKKRRKPEGLILKPSARLAKAVADAMKESMAPYLEKLTDPKSQKEWFRHITPPSECDFKQFAFFAQPIPKGARGYIHNDVSGKVYFDKKVTDITGLFTFVPLHKKWLLSYKMLKTM